MKHIRKYRSQGLLQLRATLMRFSMLFRSPFFWLVTICGNVCVVSGALVFHHLEWGTNPAIKGYLDSFTWAVGMVSTVGTSNVIAVTPGGKLLSIMMMMGGAVFLWSYMALFVGAFVDPELRGIRRNVTELHHDLEEGERLLLKLQTLTEELESHLVRQRDP